MSPLDLIFAYLAGMGLALVVFGFLRELRRDFSTRMATSADHARRRAPPPWVCSRCHSANRPEAEQCYRGCGMRRDVEQPRPAVAPPDAFDDDGSLVAATLDEVSAHAAAAQFHGRSDLAVALTHDDARGPTPDHWVVRVDGRVVARAARREVAAAFLRDLDPAAPVFLSPEGAGFIRYRLADVLTSMADPPSLPPAYRCRLPGT